MKYRTVWKPGGHPRRNAGPMKADRRKLRQAIKPGDDIEKEAKAVAETRKKAA